MPIILDGAPDPVATLKPIPGVDYWELARANLAVAESGVLDMQRLAAELVAIQQRIANGDWWLMTEPHNHPERKTAEGTMARLQDDRHSAELELAAVEMQVWKATCSTWVAVQMVRRTPNAPDDAQNRSGRAKTLPLVNDTLRACMQAGHCSDPASLWRSLVGDREPPGSFPLTEADLTLETMKAWPYSAGHWEAEELESLLEQKR